MNKPITAYTAECIPYSSTDNTTGPCMIPDKDGWWVSLSDHENVVSEMSDRITYLENCYQEVLDQLTR